GVPETDAELIVLLAELLEDVSVRGTRLHLSSLGTPETRSAYREELTAYLRAHEQQLSPGVRGRIELNPMRAFDATDRGTRAVVRNAPKLLDRLSDEDAEHFAQVRALLDQAGIKYELDPTLVRGLDYYTRTVFEFSSDALGAQSGVGGGGRYDGLIEQLGGKPAPAVGWGLGIERLLLLLEAVGIAPPDQAPDAYLVVGGDAARVPAMAAAEALRARGVAVLQHAQGADGLPSLKAQFKKANASGARFALVFAGEELARGMVGLKPLREGESQQVERPLADVASWAAELRNA
ncbi:MAG TPA: ATP phosphoribosyltransferase regulatory subunit, partial [Burkholderiaceae bacterium]|nr:ATP phosphoribosyltransferase regulatory subunit [Burkholderiaceae bacterium]